ncbi:MAG: hypothetical protein A2008_02285 [Candidatus Wallbacteria bacterium GWC2_49_35]|uniref:CR-type domain-containing protein n=1 Tax=Candidatus Wallbacteria bacterium GWC2_49_35 TaxID=1817813 RepID=A0A1F7WRV9_9BACT|nr:MAG: hypothetical protein A2008_02285 [Candidatus Wallbacteria bacterium GWC2_49_35]HBC75345.1 hypothetical protein [Candidatus Wallbacteria bacterium]
MSTRKNPSVKFLILLSISALMLLVLFPAQPVSAAETSGIETGTPHQCEKCAKKGIVVCGNCKGSGMAKSNTTLYRDDEKHCIKCDGKGKRLCNSCAGETKFYSYPAADEKSRGYLHTIFKIEAKKNKPAPSTVTLIVDGIEVARKNAEGRVRVFDFGKVPLSPGAKHRMELAVFIKKGIAGYHYGRIYIHNVKIVPGKVTLCEGGRKSLKLNDDTRVEDWEDEYRGLYVNTEETGSFKIIDNVN